MTSPHRRMTGGAQTAQRSTRKAIMDVAEAHLARVGYQGVSLQEIAAEVGLSKPAIYYHFPGGKEELFVSILHRSLDAAREGLQRSVAGQGCADERLRAAVHWLMGEPGRGRGLDRMQDVTRFVADEHHVELASRYQQAHQQPLRDVVADGIASLEFRVLDPDFVAWSILSLVAGLLQARPYEADRPLTDIVDRICDLVLRGIRHD